MRWGFVVYHMCKIPLSKEQFLRAVISSFQMQADKICLKKRVLNDTGSIICHSFETHLSP